MKARLRYIDAKPEWWWYHRQSKMMNLGWWRDFHPDACRKAHCCLCHWEKNVEDKARANKKRAAIKFELNA